MAGVRGRKTLNVLADIPSPAKGSAACTRRKKAPFQVQRTHLAQPSPAKGWVKATRRTLLKDRFSFPALGPLSGN